MVGSYIALIRKEADSDYGVDFPDLPGCVTAGSTLDEAAAMAREALALHLEGLEAEGEAWPEPSSLEDIMALADSRDAAAILVPAPKPKGRAARINITVDENLLGEIDAAAGPGERSGFLSQAARVALRSTPLPTATSKAVEGITMISEVFERTAPLSKAVERIAASSEALGTTLARMEEPAKAAAAMAAQMEDLTKAAARMEAFTKAAAPMKARMEAFTKAAAPMEARMEAFRKAFAGIEDLRAAVEGIDLDLAPTRKTAAKRKTAKRKAAKKSEPKKAPAEKKTAKRRIAAKRRKGKPTSAKRRTRA